MARLTFYPLGNADCCLIELDDGRTVVMDYAATGSSESGDKKIDLPEALRDDIGAPDCDEIDVVAFSHRDKDHYQGASEFFHFEHAAKYQGPGRMKITELWVPAALIVERGPDATEAKAIQAEARYRLEKGEGIRVFSRPDALKEWLEGKNLTLESRRHLLTDAGQLVPNFKIEDGVEFFVHSPFAERAEDGSLIDRNGASLAFQATFSTGGRDTRVLFLADLEHESISAIARITKARGNDARLKFDVAGLPHHSSYLSLAFDKGTNKTVPVEDVKWLYETQGGQCAYFVSTSDQIPTEDTIQPPHRQAASYYEEAARSHLGEYVVTMEHPNRTAPERLVIEIDGRGATRKKRMIGAAAAISTKPPKAG